MSYGSGTLVPDDFVTERVWVVVGLVVPGLCRVSEVVSEHVSVRCLRVLPAVSCLSTSVYVVGPLEPLRRGRRVSGLFRKTTTDGVNLDSVSRTECSQENSPNTSPTIPTPAHPNHGLTDE